MQIPIIDDVCKTRLIPCRQARVSIYIDIDIQRREY